MKVLNSSFPAKYGLIILSIFFASSIFAGNPRVISVTMSPTNPAFGDAVQITVNYCGQMYQDHRIGIAISSLAAKDNADLSGNGQVFVVSRAGVNVATSQPATTPGGEIGYVAQLNPNGGTANCMTCGSGSNDGLLFTKVYNVTVPPAAYYPGCNVTTLYLHVGMKDNNIGAGEWQTLPACQSNPVAISWPIGTIAKNFEISKRVEGVLQATNDLVLYSIDYKYWNGQLTITDNIPGAGNFNLVSWGPRSIGGTPMTGPAINATTGAFSWPLPNRTGMPGVAEGTLWMLLRMNNNVAAGTRFSNLATGVMSGVSNQTAAASLAVGQAAVTIIKDQSASNPNYGDDITYFLSYQVNGSKLVAYQPFDDINLGTYGTLNGTGGTAVPGWNFNPQGGTEGEWRILDPCNTGDRYIRGDAGVGNQFPSLLYNGPPAIANMCKNIIMTDVMIEPGGYEGADALVVIRSDGLPGGNAYALAISIDDFIGTNSTGNIGFQRCLGGTCIWPLSVNSIAITANKWWRVKIETAPPPLNNQYAFRAKVWAKGDPEPGAWTITWTDPAPPAGFDCNVGTWRPGIAEQHGASGDVSDNYNDFIVYEPRVSADTIVWDTKPAGVIFVGQQGPHPRSGAGTNPILWDLSTISDEGGTFTWWGTVDTCNPITNDAWINGASPMVANQSNQVIAYPICPTPVITLDKTANPMSISVGGQLTFTIQACNSAAGPPATPFSIWDTIVSNITFGGFVSQSAGLTPHQAGQYLYWDMASLAAGACVNVVWWGTLSSFPKNPLETEKYFFVENNMLYKRDMFSYSASDFRRKMK